MNFYLIVTSIIVRSYLVLTWNSVAEFAFELVPSLGNVFQPIGRRSLANSVATKIQAIRKPVDEEDRSKFLGLFRVEKKLKIKQSEEMKRQTMASTDPEELVSKQGDGILHSVV